MKILLKHRTLRLNLQLSFFLPFPAELVTQFKNTVLLLSSGPIVVTGIDFPAENYKSEMSVTDPELKVITRTF